MWGSEIYAFLKGVKLDFICMKMKLMKNKKKYLQQKFSRKVRRVKNVCPFYMYIPYGNAFCADSSQALQVKN